MTCPTCGVVLYWLPDVLGFGSWLPDGPVNRAKNHAIRGEKLMLGQMPMAWVDGYLMTPAERREVDEFQKRWLHPVTL